MSSCSWYWYRHPLVKCGIITTLDASKPSCSNNKWDGRRDERRGDMHCCTRYTNYNRTKDSKWPIGRETRYCRTVTVTRRTNVGLDNSFNRVGYCP